jgi:hypothetical protein
MCFFYHPHKRPIEVFFKITREKYEDKIVVPIMQSISKNMTMNNQCNALNQTCFRMRNQNARHVLYSHLLGESTPPQGVNCLIHSDPNLLDPWSRIVRLV